MGFRDELVAARARIAELERDVRELRAARAARIERRTLSMLATVCAVLALALIGTVTLALYEMDRAVAAETSHARVLDDGAETARVLQQTVARLEAERAAGVDRGSLGPDDEALLVAWAEGTAHEEWTGEVTERIGEAPVAAGATCVTTIARDDASTPQAVACTLHVRCGDTEIYPPALHGALVRCELSGAAVHIETNEAWQDTPVRAHGGAGDLRVDEGPLGTWAIRIERSSR